MKIVVLDGYMLNPGDNPWDQVAALGQLEIFDLTPEEQIVSRIGDAEVVITNKVPISAETLSRCPQLKMIAVTATGFNVIDIEAARERGVVVSNVPIYGTQSVAQHVFALLLSWIRQPERHYQAVLAGRWQQEARFSFWLNHPFELTGKTMGIVGLGRIGRATAKLADAFGMRVIAHSRTERQKPGYLDFAWRSLDQLFAESDVISLHCPQTSENIGFVDSRLLGMTQPHAILINTARGTLVNEFDLANALNSGQLAAALLDVVSTEPIRQDNPLLSAKNCLITPHNAWVTIEARQRLMITTAENIAAYQQGNPINVVTS